MKLLIFGNIASGKSTLCAFLQSRLEGFEYISVDNFRRQFGNGTQSAELLALKQFQLSIRPGTKQVIEAMGLGRTAELIANQIPKDEPVLMVVLTTSYDVCLARLSARKELIPYPNDQDKGEELLKESAERFPYLIKTLHPFHNHKVQCIHQACESITHAQTIIDTILQNVHNQ